MHLFSTDYLFMKEEGGTCTRKMVNLCIVAMKAISKLTDDLFIVNNYMPVITTVCVP